MTTMVRMMARVDQLVQAPAPALGSPSMPAPTQTLAMMQAPPMTDGVDVMCVTPNLSQSSEKKGHRKWARVILYVSGSIRIGAAIHNARIKGNR